MTKGADEFSQFTEPVTCRECTLPKDAKLSDPKGWIRGNTKIGPVLEVTTSYLQGKYWVEISIESVNKDNSHSWVRITHGLNKLVCGSRSYATTRRTTTTSRKPLRCSSKILRWKRMFLVLRSDQRPKQNHKEVFLPAHPQKLYPLGKNLDRYWATRLFVHRLSSVEEINSSSSTCKNTKRRWWSGWIL